MPTIEEMRYSQLLAAVPDVFTPIGNGEFKRFLYIGAYAERFHFKQPLEAAAKSGMKVDLLEINEGRANDVYDENPWLNQVLINDVVEFDSPSYYYDEVIWSHGPTTIYSGDFHRTMDKITQWGKRIILMMPWGIFKDADDVREIDRNKWAAFPGDLALWHFMTSTMGQQNKRHSNLLAWRDNEWAFLKLQSSLLLDSSPW